MFCNTITLGLFKHSWRSSTTPILPKKKEFTLANWLPTFLSNSTCCQASQGQPFCRTCTSNSLLDDPFRLKDPRIFLFVFLHVSSSVILDYLLSWFSNEFQNKYTSYFCHCHPSSAQSQWPPELQVMSVQWRMTLFWPKSWRC